MRRVAAALLVLAAACSCGESQRTPAERGREVYLANCTACHASDPNAAGTLGPPVAGASRELLEARVLRAEYPPGYQPVRDTRVMVALPHLAGSIDDLAAYLAEAKP